jgi:hypothetical protein
MTYLPPPTHQRLESVTFMGINTDIDMSLQIDVCLLVINVSIIDSNANLSLSINKKIMVCMLMSCTQFVSAVF